MGSNLIQTCSADFDTVNHATNQPDFKSIITAIVECLLKVLSLVDAMNWRFRWSTLWNRWNLNNVEFYFLLCASVHSRALGRLLAELCWHMSPNVGISKIEWRIAWFSTSGTRNVGMLMCDRLRASMSWGRRWLGENRDGIFAPEFQRVMWK